MARTPCRWLPSLGAGASERRSRCSRSIPLWNRNGRIRYHLTGSARVHNHIFRCRHLTFNVQPSSRAGKRSRNWNPPWNESMPQNIPDPTVLFHFPKLTCRFPCPSCTPTIPTKNALKVTTVMKSSLLPCAKCLAGARKASGRARFTLLVSSPSC